MVRPGLGISVMIASLLATGVAVAGTGLPATATVPSPVRSMFHGSYEPPKNPEHDAPIHGIPSDLARDGAVVFVLLHEISHALFDRLRVPILGREEDAADQLAAFMLLRAGEGVARRVLVGAAWMYLHDAAGRMPDETDFSDVHGLDSQRFYNVLCMAHGSNPTAFRGIVEKGYLPKDRAESCAEEYLQVSYAARKLIDPSMDAKTWARTREKHKARWEKR